jgi:hypothetical protein
LHTAVAAVGNVNGRSAEDEECMVVMMMMMMMMTMMTIRISESASACLWISCEISSLGALC